MPDPRRRTWSRLARTKAAPGGSPGFAWGGGPAWSDAFRSRRGPTPSELVESFKSIIYFAARTNSKAVSRVPLKLYVRTKPGQAKPRFARDDVGRTAVVSRTMKTFLKGRDYLAKALAGDQEVEEVTEHPILEVLRNPNRFIDETQLIEYTINCMDVVGYAFHEPVFKTVGGSKVPVELWPLPAQTIFPIPSGTSLVPCGFQYYSKRYELDDLIWVRWMSLRNPYMEGMSPARAAIEYARLEDEFVSVQDAVLANGPRPALVVSPKDALGSFGDKAARDRIRNEMVSQLRGGKQGGVAVVDGAMDVKPVSWQPADLGALKISEYDLERIGNCFDVPPTLFSKDTNLANIQAALDVHAVNGVEPRCKAVASAFTRYFHQLDAGGNLGWDRLFLAFDPVAPEDKKLQAEYHKTYWDMGVLATNEVRADLNLPPVENGDVITVSNALTTLDAIVNPPDPPPTVVMPPGGGKPATKPGEGEKRHPFRWRSDVHKV